MRSRLRSIPSLAAHRVWDALNDISRLSNIMTDMYLRQLSQDTRYSDPKKLNRFEFQVYSQSGEDGILCEVFRRIGTTNCVFVEFGVGEGLENNTTHLLVNGWTGYWAEGDAALASAARRKFGRTISDRKLVLSNTFVTAENISQLFSQMGVPREFDVLSIDIDGNDYWVWKALEAYSPRVVVIEYNALFRPPTRWVMRYDPRHVWTGSSCFGASLKSLELLGKEKGYSLVACNLAGVNAFFVRSDLCAGFSEPYAAENHYEPPRQYLIRKVGFRDFGDFERI